MTHTCAKTLSELRKIANTTDAVLSFMGDAPHICLYDDPSVFFDYSKTKYGGEMHAIINELARIGCLTWIDPAGVFTLTHKGLHPYQMGWDSFKVFFLRSIAVPIGVSAATSLITLWLQGLL